VRIGTGFFRGFTVAKADKRQPALATLNFEVSEIYKLLEIWQGFIFMEISNMRNKTPLFLENEGGK
jgi:hypothetical protein